MRCLEHAFSNDTLRTDGEKSAAQEKASYTQAIMESFSKKKGSLATTEGRPFTYTLGRVSVFLDPETIQECFDAAMEGPLLLVRRKLEQLRLLTDSVPKIVVSGGTSRHEGVKIYLEKMCAEFGLPRPIFTTILDIEQEYVGPKLSSNIVLY